MNFMERVIAEKKELDERIVRLVEFTRGEIYESLPDDEQVRLARQQNIMSLYSDVLGQRIAAFNERFNGDFNKAVREGKG